MQSQSRSVMPTCIKNEKPLLVTTQVKLVDPADEYVTYNELHFVFIVIIDNYFVFCCLCCCYYRDSDYRVSCVLGCIETKCE